MNKMENNKGEINIIELASETAMAYVDNLAIQLDCEHSDYNEQEQTGYFKPQWQDTYEDIYNLIEKYIEKQGFKHKN